MTETEKATQKQCFVVVTPIGPADSPERTNADWLLNGIIKPVLEIEPFDYKVIRGDDGGPGRITNQVINYIFESDLIVADLTGKNANVFYELAVAHTANKTVIPMMTAGERLPFDNYDERTIFYDREKFEGVEKAKSDLAAMTRRIEAPNFSVDNPVVSARGYQKIMESGDPRDKMLAEIPTMLANVQKDVARLEGRLDSQSLSKSLADYGANPLRTLRIDDKRNRLTDLDEIKKYFDEYLTATTGNVPSVKKDDLDG